MKGPLIITHPGNAHFDEVTANSLILVAYTDVKLRVERHEPEKHNFANMDKPILVYADVNKSPKISNIGDDTLQLHSRSETIYCSNVRSESYCLRLC
jgi:hypothetical protein